MPLCNVFIPVRQSEERPNPSKPQISPVQVIGPEVRHRASVALRQRVPSAKLSPPSAVRIGATDSSAALEWQRAGPGWFCRVRCERRQVIPVEIYLDVPSLE